MAIHFFWLIGLFVILAIIAVPVIVLVVVFATHRPAQTVPAMPVPGAAPGAQETPLDVLARRFANGEINADEYQKARDLLKE